MNEINKMLKELLNTDTFFLMFNNVTKLQGKMLLVSITFCYFAGNILLCLNNKYK